MTDKVEEDVRAVFKSDMETADLMYDLIEEHDVEDIGDASLDVVEDLVQKVEHPRRLSTLFATCYQIGQSTGNEEMVKFAQQHLEQINGGGDERQ